MDVRFTQSILIYLKGKSIYYCKNKLVFSNADDQAHLLIMYYICNTYIFNILKISKIPCPWHEGYIKCPWHEKATSNFHKIFHETKVYFTSFIFKSFYETQTKGCFELKLTKIIRFLTSVSKYDYIKYSF